MNDNVAMKKAENIAFFACFLQFLFFLLTFSISYWNSLSIRTQSLFYMMGIVVWFLSYLSLRQERLAEEEEQAEKEYVTDNKNSIFDEADQLDPLSARNRLKTFRDWIIPIASLLLAISFITIAVYNLFKINNGSVEIVEQAPLSAAFLGGFAFFSLLIAKYALGMAQRKNLRILRSGGSFLYVNAATSFLCCLAVALSHTGFNNLDMYVAYGILTIMSLIGIEILFNLLLDFYRPRISDQETRVPFDSRILEVSSGSKGVLKTIAQMFDYQFGFKVSETWFYQFMEQAIAPLLLFQIFSLYILNCIVFVNPSEKVIIERFGTPNRIYAPGFHTKWPWPVERSVHVDMQKTHSIIVGQFGEMYNEEIKKFDEYGDEIIPARIFAKKHHADEDVFLIIGKQQDENLSISLVVARAAISYSIEDLKSYIYKHQNPELLIDSLANKVMTRYFASAKLDDLIGKDRQKTSEFLKKEIQNECMKKQLGISILSCNLLEAHPPSYVALDFENVISALETKETKIEAGKTYKEKVEKKTEAYIKEIILQARIKQLRKVKSTVAKAHVFENTLKAYKQDPEIFLIRQYLSALEENLKNRRLIITNIQNVEHHVDSLNLEDSGMKIVDYDIPVTDEDENNSIEGN
ncbi:protease modulator HflK [Candidatus Uabimicrobium sp. HlEnr_7]|uniref:protease modulator HflK n=1 Tax=Candidatus Uabimicrobium helgolandensis TaxID=3095367 RepID=UPI00355652B0